MNLLFYFIILWILWIYYFKKVHLLFYFVYNRKKYYFEAISSHKTSMRRWIIILFLIPIGWHQFDKVGNKNDRLRTDEKMMIWRIEKCDFGWFLKMFKSVIFFSICTSWEVKKGVKNPWRFSGIWRGPHRGIVGSEVPKYENKKWTKRVFQKVQIKMSKSWSKRVFQIF